MRPSIAFSVAHCGLCLVLLGWISMALGTPLLIPAIGASAYIVFAAPLSEVSAPRNVLVGHAVGAGVGWLMPWLFGLGAVPGGLDQALTWQRIGAVAGSLAVTIGLLRLARSSHPPAGATTMIVSVGVLPRADHVLDFLIAACVVVLYAAGACRAAGLSYPVWSSRSSADGR